MFSNEALERSNGYAEKFLNHPFLIELSKGELPREKFVYFIQQDNIFLADMDQARKILVSREKSEKARRLSSLIRSVYRYELRAKRDLITRELKPDEGSVEAAPTTLAYTSYLIRLACTGSFEEAFAALIPCPRLYTMIGEKYHSCPASSHPIYGKWLSIYASSEMRKWTQRLLDLLDQLASKSSSRNNEMMRSYLTACRYEIRFFEMAYRQENWD